MALSSTQFEKLKTKLATSPVPVSVPQSFLADAGSDIGQIGTDILRTGKETFKKQSEALEASMAGEQSAFTGLKQAFGIGAGGVSSAVGDVIKGGVKAVLPQSAETAIKDTIQTVAQPVMETEFIKNLMSGYEALDEKSKRDIDAKLGVASLASDFLGLGLAKKGVKPVVTAVKDIGAAAQESVAPVLESVQGLATGLKDITTMSAEGVSRIPSRIATNVAEKKAVRETINQLPTKVAKQAVQDGADIADIKYLYQLPAEQKAPLKTLWEATKDFESGVSKTNPIEVVGKPIVNRIKELESARGTIGQKLGEVADTLGTVTTKEAYPTVFNSLKKVGGLNGLKINSRGILDFTDTVLATAGSASDRKAIQSIFNSAIKNGTGKQKHLLRQELFEILGGKKKSLTALTDTQEKAYEAIRKGLSDVLDTKNTKYKALNQQYAKVAQPLQDMRKYMKNVAGASEDILDMNAGLIARRLTSFSKSNPEIRNVLKAMDEATKTKGTARLSVENLQDFYNILDRYYDIAGKTGFQGQVKAGVESASGFRDAISKAVGDVIGKTDAVKRKAIEDALSEALQ